MAQRISRAKQRIKAAAPRSGCRRGRSAPAAPRSARPLPDVQRGLRRHPPVPQLHRVDLSDEAIRLARWLHRPLPDDAETAGLLALMLLTDARPAGPHPAGRPRSCHWRSRTAAGGTAARSPRARPARRGHRPPRGRVLPASGGDRRVARPGADGPGHRLAADPRPVRPARADGAQPGGHPQPRRRGRDGARPGGRAWRCWRRPPRPR